MNCEVIGTLNRDLDDKDIGDFGCGPVYITREFGNAAIRSEEPVPPIPEVLGLDDHDTYRITYMFGHLGCFWQGMTDVLIHRGTPLWESLSELIGGGDISDIGIFNVSEDGTRFNICWKKSL
ncbi:MAG: hypothetical protein GF334_10240 [Candidatus Altiarchaeales archaeon]|nr:hypothetical protein [Candidatus Altiarchaeales archaeon]